MSAGWVVLIVSVALALVLAVAWIIATRRLRRRSSQHGDEHIQSGTTPTIADHSATDAYVGTWRGSPH